MARRAVTAPADGKRPQPLVSVLVGYETFRGRVCELADRIVITPGTVASLMDEALIERVVFDGPSRVLDLGRARRFTGAVRRALDVLDRGCTHAGCNMPAERCQGDHIQPWSRGGETDPENGQLRCAYHNRWRWEHGDGDPHAATLQRPPPDADLERRKAWLEAWRARLRDRMLAEPPPQQPAASPDRPWEVVAGGRLCHAPTSRVERGRFVLGAAGGPVDLDRDPLRGGP
jgi:hypothetical protein